MRSKSNQKRNKSKATIQSSSHKNQKTESRGSSDDVSSSANASPYNQTASGNSLSPMGRWERETIMEQPWNAIEDILLLNFEEESAFHYTMQHGQQKQRMEAQLVLKMAERIPEKK